LGRNERSNIKWPGKIFDKILYLLFKKKLFLDFLARTVTSGEPFYPTIRHHKLLSASPPTNPHHT
jgi:hypothetical protein